MMTQKAKLQTELSLTETFNRGLYTEAERIASTIVGLNPKHKLAWKILGATYARTGRLPSAQSAFARHVELVPRDAEGHSNLGAVLHALGQPEDAEVCFRKAIRLQPNYVEAFYNLALVQAERGQFIGALENYQKVVVLKPHFPEAHNNLGAALVALGRFDEAEASYRKAITQNPDHFSARSNLLFCINHTRKLNAAASLNEAIRFGSAASKNAHVKFDNWMCIQPAEKLKVGFVSGDFRNHPVGHFLEAVLSNADQSKFEFIAYVTGGYIDDLTRRISTRFVKMTNLSGRKDAEAAKIIHDDSIHILIDLSGHTAHNRLPVFAYKPAPIQVSWLGYFATTGLPEIDYILGDPYVIPIEEEDHFSERVWRLPESYLCFSPPQDSPEVCELPAIQNGHLTFGCFNRLNKISNAAIEQWCQLLQALPDSKLFLKTHQLSDPDITHATMSRFALHGIEIDRLILEGRSPRREMLEAYNRVDIALDTFPYSGGTTSAESLWMGVPVVMMRGDNFVSHIGESIALNANLADWIVEDNQAYTSKIFNLAKDIPYLAELRQHLRARLLKTPLFDAKKFARNFESALWGMWDNLTNK
jgi:predicted O-linked N-acetylglucosamine transferase (SPINDLY family)